jgi:hypothetical protein
MRLEVRQTKTKKSSTEAAFEEKLAAALMRRGIFSYHTSEKFISGIPDRCVVKGNWIEVKAIPYTGKRLITPVRFFSPTQRLWLRRFHDAGDRTFASVLFQPENGEPRVIMCPWMAFLEHGSMKPSFIEEHGSIVNNRDAMDHFVGTRFDRSLPGWSDYTMKVAL